jgi:hypothetical protein
MKLCWKLGLAPNLQAIGNDGYKESLAFSDCVMTFAEELYLPKLVPIITGKVVEDGVDDQVEGRKWQHHASLNGLISLFKP